MRTAVGRGGQHGKRAVYAPLWRASTARAGTPAGLAGTVRLSRAAVNPPEGLSPPQPGPMARRAQPTRTTEPSVAALSMPPIARTLSAPATPSLRACPLDPIA